VQQIATLARVRDNQRRCRARKREYVLKLERKIHDLEAAGAQVSVVSYQTTVRRLEAENKRLRELLNRAGFSQGQVEAQLYENHDAGNQEGSLIQIEGQGSICAMGNVNEYTEPEPFEAVSRMNYRLKATSRGMCSWPVAKSLPVYRFVARYVQHWGFQ
jgi:hypothetical protein